MGRDERIDLLLPLGLLDRRQPDASGDIPMDPAEQQGGDDPGHPPSPRDSSGSSRRLVSAESEASMSYFASRSHLPSRLRPMPFLLKRCS